MKVFINIVFLVSFLSNSQIIFAQDTPNTSLYFETAKQKELFRKEIQSYILENPEIIIQAIRIYQNKIKEEAATKELQILQSKKSEIFNDKFSFVAGNKNGKIKIVEFIDYKCGYCKKNHAIIWSIIKSNPDVKYIAKEFPILGAQSRLAAQALLAILLEDTNEIYKNFSNLLISHSGTINISILKEFAVKSGSKIINLNNIMKSKKVNSLIANNMSLAQTLGIDGTPTFIIGEQIIRGFISKNEMQQLIEIIREKL